MSTLHFVFGRLSLNSLPFWAAVQHPTPDVIINGAVATGAGSIVLFGAAVTVGLITWFGKWRHLWDEWLTSVDHKRIGIMYITIAFVMLARALIEAGLLRTQQAFGLGGGFLSPEHFGQLFTTHGTIQIFFMAMPFLIGLINIVVPIQIGTRDVSFPVMNSVSLGLTAAGAAIVMISLVVGKFSTGGWSGYPPYTELPFNPGVGPDYWIWAVSLSSIGTMMTGINFAVTIYKRRAPGMTLMRMPLFTWTALATAILMIFAMPPLTVATAMLALDRYLGFHFFTNAAGGNMMNYTNLFWEFGHPEVYILILPAFGIYSEVIPTFSGKVLYGYSSLILATISIAFLSFTVWLHHFFTMGQTAGVNETFGIATMMIGIPTGVKVYDWMLTMMRGRIRLSVPMVYSIGFLMLFPIGGLTGIILANPSLDYQVHNTLFLIAHFHNMLVPGTLFGLLAGYHYWFPKAFGFRLNEPWGVVSALCWIFGFILAFFPLYWLGMLGFPRRTVAYYNPVYVPYMMVALLGAMLILAAYATLVIQLVVSVMRREEYRVPAGDPWNASNLEWSIPAPAPEYNFAVLPEVTARGAFMIAKEHGTAYRLPEHFTDIEMPKNSALGMIVCVTGALGAFALVWHIWWMLAVALLGTVVAVIWHGSVRDFERTIPAHEIREEYVRWLKEVAAAEPVTRDDETAPSNAGLAEVHETSEAAQ